MALSSLPPQLTINGQAITDAWSVKCREESWATDYPYRAEITYADGQTVRYRAARLEIQGDIVQPHYVLIDAWRDEPIKVWSGFGY